MTLEEYMQGAKPSMTYFIGSKSSFLFIGNKDKFAKDIDTLEKENKEHWEHMYKTARDCLKSLSDKGFPTDPEKVERYNQKMDEFGARVLMLKQQIDEYKPLLKREILENYKKTINRGMVLILEGNETGQYWFEHEYDNKTVQKESEWTD